MAADFSREVHCLLGLPFDAVDLPGAVARVRRSVAENKPLFLSTPNLNFLVACMSDPEFRTSVLVSDLSIADGMPIVWLAGLLGVPLRQRVAGSAVFDGLRPDAAVSVFFFGGPDGAAAAACRRLRDDGDGMRCVGFASPGFGSVEEMSGQETIDRINASRADVLVVALGARKGQAWIMRNRARLTVPVVSHLGAVVNFVAGTITRAPAWMQGAGLEWLWRIKEEPGLWRRYWLDGRRLLWLLGTRVLPYAWHQRCYRPSAEDLADSSARSCDEGGVLAIVLAGAWGRINLAPLRASFSRAAAVDKDLRLDLNEVSWIDSAFLGLVLLLQGHQTSRGRRLRVSGVQAKVRRVFELSSAGYILKD